MLTDGEMLYRNRTNYFYGPSFCRADCDIFENSKKHLKVYFLMSGKGQSRPLPYSFQEYFSYASTPVSLPVDYKKITGLLT